MMSATTRDRIRSFLPSLAFTLLLIAVAAWSIAIMFRQLGYGLEYDEAYLLGVARNLAEGRGYVDDGVTFLSTSETFSPVISTGPTVVLPAAAAWWATDGSLVAIRATMMMFFLLLMASTWLLFSRLGGRWVALAAVSGLALLPILSPDLQNGSLMPGRVVGELPALALFIFAGWLLARSQPLLSGLAAGAALEAKLTFLIAVAGMGVVMLVARYREQGWKSAIGWIWFALGIAIPVVAFELYKLAALGVGGYQRHLESVRGFADAQNIPLTQMPSVLSSHLSSAAGLISVSIILVVVLLVIAWLRAKRATLPSGFGSSPTHQPDVLHIVIALTVGIALMFGWWLLRSQQASPRPAVPAVLWIAVAASGITMMLLRRIALRNDQWTRALAATLYLVLLVTVGLHAIHVALDDSGARLLAEQQDAAQWLITNHGSVPIDEYWTNPELLILSGLPPDLDPVQKLTAFTSIRALNETQVPDARVFRDKCVTSHFDTPSVLICFAFPTWGP